MIWKPFVFIKILTLWICFIVEMFDSESGSTFFFWPCRAACGNLVPGPGIKPTPSAVKAQSPDHWTARQRIPWFYILHTLMAVVAGKGTSLRDVSPGGRSTSLVAWMFSSLMILLFFYFCLFVLAASGLRCSMRDLRWGVRALRCGAQASL